MLKSKILKIDYRKPDTQLIKKAALVIKDGGVIVYPTDTCYGIGASAFNKRAIQRVFKIKGRNFNKPLSIIIKNIRGVKSIAELDDNQQDYTEKKLPGKYTLILKKKRTIPDILTAGKDSIGIRIPDCSITKLLSQETIIPYTTTSANLSDQPSCFSVSDFLKQIKNNTEFPDLILDAGILPHNKLSKIIDLRNNDIKILRK